MEVSVTKMSSNGQVVISSDVRKALGLSPGDKFLVIGEEDGIVLKSLEKEDIKHEMEVLLSDIGEEIKKTGISKEDVEKEIEEYRKEKRKEQ
ncbi:MAG: AbrB/MazE/SpoVT family DNA-binding domain-containing protein [Candidatus Thermoplasmatota archaeon]|nr:AbrB/MazE/SpoVT family DNA-binding domain-containing protein [Candidatus Thermoplasmatota archaeon]